jgi:hypothetical protein
VRCVTTSLIFAKLRGNNPYTPFIRPWNYGGGGMGEGDRRGNVTHFGGAYIFSWGFWWV